MGHYFWDNQARVFALILSVLVSTLLVMADSAISAKIKGIQVAIKDQQGNQVGLYNESHALLIGASEYTAGWPNLESVPFEINRVEKALRKQGFSIKTVMNPNSHELFSAFDDFIDEFGFDEDNRLLFFFSGHGHTRKNGTKGYLVPTDAPNPNKNKKEFLRKSLLMSQIIEWSKQIEAKHALFLFDSCFSGTIFKSKDLPSYPPYISDLTSRPVRQFISAGSAGETVPAQSVFTPLVIRALEGNGDLNRDGYVTGTEMGMYLQEKVHLYDTGQHPQYGKIRDINLDEGDFVFLVRKSSGLELMHWEQIKDSTNMDDFIDFITQYPNGEYSNDARIKLKGLFSKKVAKLTIRSNVFKDKVFINEKPYGATRVDVDLEPGIYDIRVEKIGYDTFKNKVEITEGERKVVRANLTKKILNTGKTGWIYLGEFDSSKWVKRVMYFNKNHLPKKDDIITVRINHLTIRTEPDITKALTGTVAGKPIGYLKKGDSVKVIDVKKYPFVTYVWAKIKY